MTGARRLGLPSEVRACLFDMDGVLTRTAAAHRAAWQETFDPVLARHGQGPFTESDYLRFVDGRPRADGVREFLASRGIRLPEGTPGDPAGLDTVAGVAAGKNARLLDRLTRDGVQVYEGSVGYVHAAREAGLRIGVVTASANGAAVLRSAGIGGLVDALVDGVVAQREGLAGKPAPDTYLACARELGAGPDQAAVFEDALAGVAAGRAGGFRLVVGVDRAGQAAALRAAGADVVVTDLADLAVAA